MGSRLLLSRGESAACRHECRSTCMLAAELPRPEPSASAAMARVAGSLQKSGEVMSLVNGLIKVPELQKTMAAMSRGQWRCSGRESGPLCVAAWLRLRRPGPP